MHKQKLVLIGLILILLTVACNLSPASPTPTVDEGAVQTMVAQTVAANDGAPADNGGDTGEPQDAPTNTPEPTEAPTNTPEPTPTITLTPTPEPTLPQGIDELDLGPADATYNFDTKKPFYTYSDSTSQVEAKDGTLQFTIFDALSYTIWSFSSLELQDFYFEISVRMPDNCVGKDRGGIIFGTPINETNEGYNYQISCDGGYRLFLYDGSQTITLVPWTSSSELEAGPGKTNKIGVIHKGEKITMYINGELVNQLSDDTYVGEGRIGINMGVDNHDNVTIYFDDAAYWTNLP
ncbi:MAG: DUF1080 domain-containing protein [Anaerolineales bacterium]|jgi:hypothetical protein